MQIGSHSFPSADGAGLTPRSSWGLFPLRERRLAAFDLFYSEGVLPSLYLLKFRNANRATRKLVFLCHIGLNLISEAVLGVGDSSLHSRGSPGCLPGTACTRVQRTPRPWESASENLPGRGGGFPAAHTQHTAKATKETDSRPL